LRTTCCCSSSIARSPSSRTHSAVRRSGQAVVGVILNLALWAAKPAMCQPASCSHRLSHAGAVLFLGHGGGIASPHFDASSRKKVGEINLKGHPEGFELEPSGERAFVNVADARGIAVLDRTSSRQIATWTVPQVTRNFPMAIRQRGNELLVGFRRPARLAIVDTRSGNLRAITRSCDVSDDIFVDEKRSRAYVSCGQGFIDVFKLGDASLSRIDHIPTVAGARTALYDPELDRFFLAVKASSSAPAAIWMYQPW
jgi:hypothetical protein